MSYDNQDNFDTNPNQFGAQGGRRGGATFSDSDMGSQPGQQYVGPEGLAGTGQQGFAGSGQQGLGRTQQSQGDTWDSSLGSDDSRQRGQGDTWTSGMTDTTSGGGGYAGRTTDTTMGSGGTAGGRMGDTWDDDDNLGRQGQTQTGKPSVGDRVKGSMEKMAGKVSGNQAMAERGQERKTGGNAEYGDYGSSY